MDNSTNWASKEQRVHGWHGTVRADYLTCRSCTEPTMGYDVCRHCFGYRRLHGTADVVAPLIYAIAGTDSAALLRDYKNHPTGAVRTRRSQEIASLLRIALWLHEDCLTQAVGMPIAVRTTIPSLTLRPGVHPFAALARDVTRLKPTLIAAGAHPDCRREVSTGKFTVPEPEMVSGRHVLVLDDLWTTGSNAQSAALALRAAGAAAVSVLVVARWLNPSYPPTKAFLAWRAAEFDIRRCPVPDGACNSLGAQ